MIKSLMSALAGPILLIAAGEARLPKTLPRTNPGNSISTFCRCPGHRRIARPHTNGMRATKEFSAAHGLSRLSSTGHGRNMSVASRKIAKSRRRGFIAELSVPCST